MNVDAQIRRKWNNLAGTNKSWMLIIHFQANPPTCAPHRNILPIKVILEIGHDSKSEQIFRNCKLFTDPITVKLKKNLISNKKSLFENTYKSITFDKLGYQYPSGGHQKLGPFESLYH